MKPETLITKELIVQVKRDLYPLGLREVEQRLQSIEPELEAFIRDCASRALEHLEGWNLTSDVPANISESVRWAALLAVEAIRRGHYELWREMALGTRLEQLDPTLKRRKKS
jgi:hypothetical protein